MHETSDESWRITEIIIRSAIEVHRALGPGLLESAYEACLAHELLLRGLDIDRQRRVPVVYKGLALDVSYRIDLVVAGLVLVEVKSVGHVAPIHEAQILTYLRLAVIDVGLLIDFNARTIREGLRRFVRAGAIVGCSPGRRSASTDEP